MAAKLETLQVSASKEAYADFITTLRERVRDPNVQSHGLPVLVPQSTTPQYLDIVLQTANGSAVTLRLRKDNLYLVAYCAGSGTPWYEFSNDTKAHLVAGSQFLGFDGSYQSLQGASAERSKISLGRKSLEGAVINLVSTSSPSPLDKPSEARAKALVVVIQMVCESMRFRSITEDVMNGYDKGFVPSEHMRARETSWGALSDVVLTFDNNNSGLTKKQWENFEPSGITSLPQAVAALGILLRRGITTTAQPHLNVKMHALTALGAVSSGVATGRVVHGRRLAEIFYVRMQDVDDKIAGDLCGTVSVTDGLGQMTVFSRPQENAESIHPGGTATLTGPERAISAEDDFTIDCALRGRNFSSLENDLGHGRIWWNAYDPTKAYDKLLTTTIPGAHGATELGYAVMSNAAGALVSVMILDLDGSDRAAVHGSIRAENTSLVGNVISLWEARRDRPVRVTRGSSIALDRSAVVVPMSGSLVVIVDVKSIADGATLASGSARFSPAKPETPQTNTWSIGSTRGQIEVKVSWS